MRSFKKIEIEGYTDWELQQALENKGIAVGSIPMELQKLIRKPRYCEVVSAHFDEMKADGDFTVERLIFLSARHLAEAKRGRLSEAKFIEIIQNLALRYRQNPDIRLGDIPSLIPFADTEWQVAQEIVDGGFLVPKSPKSTKFNVEHNRLVFGLGLLLIEELREASTGGETTQEIAEHLALWSEPHPEMDLKVEICGAALFHSFIERDYPSGARQELLRYWLGLRNWDDRSQAAYADYILRGPNEFLAVTEEFWSGRRDVGAAQDFLARAFIKHRDDPRVQPALITAVNRWMGMVHPAGQPFLRPSKDREERARKEVESRVGTLRLGPLRIYGEDLSVVDDDGLLRLARLGFLIISAGSRLPFIRSLVPWAVASAVMGLAIEAGLADWVVCLSDEEVSSILLPEAERLLKYGEELAISAARTLLWRIDPDRANLLAEENPTPDYELRQQLRKQHEADPCVGLFEWSEEECLRCMERLDLSVLRINRQN